MNLETIFFPHFFYIAKKTLSLQSLKVFVKFTLIAFFFGNSLKFFFLSSNPKKKSKKFLNKKKVMIFEF